MKLKELGLSNGALIGILVTIIVVAVIVPLVIVLALGIGGTPGNLPVWGSATHLTTNSAEGSSVAYYDLGTSNGAEVYNWEKSQMESQGWSVTVYASYTEGEGGILTATKGNESATVIIAEGDVASSINSQIGTSASKILVLAYYDGTVAS